MDVPKRTIKPSASRQKKPTPSPDATDPTPYAPPRYLADISFITTADLVDHYKDFCTSLKYVQSAPELIFERLVANISIAFKTTLDREREEAQNVLGVSVDGQGDQLKIERVELESVVKTTEDGCLKTPDDHEKPIGDNKSTRPSKDELTAELTELMSTISAQATALEGCRDENKALQSLNDELKAKLEETGEALSRQLEIVTRERNEKEKLEFQNNQLKAELERLVPTILKKKTPSIGAFHTDELQPWVQSDLMNTVFRAIYFPKAYPAPPEIPLGLNSLHVAKSHNMRIESFVMGAQTNGFKLNMYGSKNTNNAGCTWLEVAPDDPDFQCGDFTTRDQSWNMLEVVREVTFPRQYMIPPQVVVWLNRFNVDTTKSTRLRCYSTDVTTTGFKIHIESSQDAALHTAGASWVACRTNKAQVFSGTFTTLNPNPAGGPPLRKSKGCLKFGNHVFATIPRIIMAISEIDIDHRQDLSFSLRASDVTTTGMTWNVDGLSDRSNHSLRASFFVLG